MKTSSMRRMIYRIGALCLATVLVCLGDIGEIFNGRNEYQSVLTPYSLQSGMSGWWYSNDGTSAVARVGTSARLVNRPCLQMDGLDYITVPGLTVNDKVTLLGWEFGPELVGDPTMDGGWWSTAGESYLSNGIGHVYSSDGSYSAIYRNSIIEGSKNYLASYEIVEASGASLANGSGSFTWPSSAGQHTVAYPSDSTAIYFKRSSGITDYEIDNVSVKEITLNGSTSIPTVSAGQINFTAGTVAGILINDELVYTCEEGTGATLYSVSTNWSDATIVSPTAGIATVRSGTCDEASWNAQYGYTSDGGTNIPALADGSADATGGAIQYGSGYAHNGGDFSLVIGGVTNTYADLISWGPTTSGPIRNIYQYDTNGIPSLMTNVVMNIPFWGGVVTNAP